MKRIKLTLIVLVSIGLGLSAIPATQAVVDENTTKESEGISGYQDTRISGEPVVLGEEAKQPEYVKGELIVKLREGATLESLKELNEQYKVTSIEKIFQESSDPKETLDELKNNLAKLNTEHDKWYWQLDKDSQEYKDYIARIEQEKEDLTKQIQAQEELIAHLDQRQNRAPEGATTPNLENIYLLSTENKEADIHLMTKDYQRNPAIEYAEPNYIATVQMLPNDSYYTSGQLWGLTKIQAPKAWDIAQGEGVVVAVIDTGVDYNHEDLFDNIWVNSTVVSDVNGDGKIDLRDCDTNGNGIIERNEMKEDMVGRDFVNNDIDPWDDHYHGSHCAGTIAAVGNNGKGVIGVAPKAKIMAVKGLSLSGSGPSTVLAKGIKYAADMGADVSSNSYGGQGLSNVFDDAVNYATSKGCVVVVAAGNANSETLTGSPANCENAITVAATDSSDKKAYFSSYGVKIDVAAPGVDIYSTFPMARGPYASISGTSMACPHVSGLAGLIISRNLDLHKTDPGQYHLLTVEEIRQIIRKSADDIVNPLGDGSNYAGFDVYTGYGRINAYRALQFTSACEAHITYPIVNLLEWNSDYNYSNARIVSDGQIGKIDIKGIANGVNFKDFKVEYGQGVNPQTWTQARSSTTPVTGTDMDKILISQFDTHLLNAGDYTFKLTVNDTLGRAFEDRLLINTGRTFITRIPRNTTPLFFEPYDIYGYATGPAFVNYRLEYGIGSNPTVWVRASEDKYSPVNNNGILMSKFDFTKLPGGILALKLVVEDSALGVSEDTIVIDNDNLNFPNQNGFPVAGLQANSFSAPVVVDLNMDGKKEIIIGAMSGAQNYGALYAIGSHGENVFTKTIYGAPFSSPAIGNLDSDQPQEIGIKYFVYDYTLGNYTENIELFDSDGSNLAGWNKLTFPSAYSYWETLYGQSSLVFYDMDGDGKMEVIFGASASDGGKVYVYHSNGTPLAGWEIGQTTSASVMMTPAVGDLDHDGEPEIVARDKNNNIYAWRKNGTLFWTKKENGTWPDFVSAIVSIALADLNNDNYLEIVSSTFNPTGISIWKYDGTNLLSKSILSGYVYGFSIGDVNNDGLPEIIIPFTNKIHCIDINGNSLSGWPIGTIERNYPGYPLIADINNDSKKEIIFGFYQNKDLIAYNDVGVLLSGDNWPLRTYGTHLTPMALDDLDGDGDVEIIHREGFGRLRVWDLPYTYDAAKIDWPMFHHDPQHTGSYALPKDLTPPTIPVVTDGGARTNSKTQLTASWTCSDPESGIAEYQYQILQDASTGTVIRDWISTGTIPSVTAIGLTLTRGKTYYFAVKAKNEAGLWSAVGYSDGIKVNKAPSLGTITPSSGIGPTDQAVPFTTTYSDGDGWQDIQSAYFLINTSTAGKNCFYAYYDQNTNKLYLRNDANTAWLGGFAPGSSNVIQNSYAKITCSKTTVPGLGNKLTIKWNITLKSTFKGAKNMYLKVKDDNNYAINWIQKGTWTIQ
jgi:subtilisin family serine protease